MNDLHISLKNEFKSIKLVQKYNQFGPAFFERIRSLKLSQKAFPKILRTQSDQWRDLNYQINKTLLLNIIV